MPLLLSEEASRNDFIDKLKEKGIQTSIHYPPIHLFSYYKNKFGFKEGFLPKTEFVGEHEVTLPLYPMMEKEDIGYVVASIVANIENKQPPTEVGGILPA